MASEDIFVLNGYGLTERRRTNKSGAVKQRYTVEISAQPILHNLDPIALGKGPALAIAKFYRDSIAAITAVAAPATIRAREGAKRAFHHAQKRRSDSAAASSAAKAAPGYLPSGASGPRMPKQPKPAGAPAKGPAGSDRRYTGGKLGPMEPAQTTRLFHDSGRLIKSLVAALVGDEFVINVAGNRFNPDTLDNGGTAALQRIFARLRELVPQFGDASLLTDALPVRKAIRDATAGIFQQLSAAQSKGSLELVKRLMDVGRTLRETGELLADAG